MAPSKLNVLVYTGIGTTVESVRHCIWTLRRLLSPNYAVIPITEGVLIKEPWASTCALLVFPGGADLGYCQALNGEGNRRIGDFVRRGGAYLGFCAGGYYGSRRCEFEVGNRPLEVIGSRELGFFPGTCRGGAFRGFEYRSEKGARVVRLKVAQEAFDGHVPAETLSYYNGGGIFVDAASTKTNKVEVLASYEDETAVDGGDGNAAVILCSVGSGKAMLTGPHPEFAAVNLHPQPTIPGYAELIDNLADEDKSRVDFLKACLSKLGLEVSLSDAGVPSLSRLHLSSLEETGVSELLASMEDIIDKENGEEWIRGEGDTFHIQNEETIWNVESLQQSLAQPDESGASSSSLTTDYSKIVKKIMPHEKGPPHPKLTPQFNHGLYFSSLRRYQKMEPQAEEWGNLLMYGEVLTSTNTILEKYLVNEPACPNPKILSKLSTGFTVSASTQVAGRGRGSNVWVSPAGCLIFSTVINHPAHLAVSRPVVFIQYIAAIAIVEAIQSYDRGYGNLPVKLKWPNDIYALDPTESGDQPHYVKIGGILSQCLYSNGSYQIVLGIGINTNNPRPTTSISDLLPPGVPELHLETLLARILTRLEAVHAQFLHEGFSSDLEARYYRHWLHTGQAVTLEAEAGVKARVLGITRDWGMLRVEEVDSSGRGTGRLWTLQSDENSFDYWKGLVRKKT
ncbi:biotin holocarboxylase synthetase [Neonectria punicea]|uniref:Biotin holocarboxylase synthetase n=1 Tax=Neonectria punicea TaxID=979145 RepID=A0ABR1HUZ5_9HYPO